MDNNSTVYTDLSEKTGVTILFTFATIRAYSIVAQSGLGIRSEEVRLRSCATNGSQCVDQPEPVVHLCYHPASSPQTILTYF